MRRPVCYDVTRLLTRVWTATPNGIDRVDHMLARHFLSGMDERTFAACATGFGGRLMSGSAAREAVSGIAGHWGEDRFALDDDPTFRHICDWLSGRPVPARAPRREAGHRLPFSVREVAGWFGRHGLSLATSPRRALPHGGIYVNVSQFPLWIASNFTWLERRPDVKAVFFVHDLLPVTLPEYFRVAEFERHIARLRNVARFASATIVTTQAVANDLSAHMAMLGRRDLPIFVRPTPIAPTFCRAREPDPMLSGTPYFVLCSTLEPRKNHLMILAVWRALAARLGPNTPKLVLVGSRGWHYDPIVDLVERSPPLRVFVREVNGLSTPALKRLIDNAAGVLMPSFGEGYGLPVHEALAADAPVLASDIPAFREIDDARLERLSPLDGEAWLAAILRRLSAPGTVRDPRPRADWADYFTALDGFVEAL